MWTKWFVAVALLTFLWCGTSLEQVITTPAPLAATMVMPGQTNLVWMYPQLGNNRLLATNLNGGWVLPALSLNRSSPELLKPGTYKTEPYACIVIVPGKQADDRSFLKPAELGSAMPVIRPELRFIPIPSK